jgi:hypothetical protein
VGEQGQGNRRTGNVSGEAVSDGMKHPTTNNKHQQVSNRQIRIRAWWNRLTPVGWKLEVIWCLVFGIWNFGEGAS